MKPVSIKEQSTVCLPKVEAVRAETMQVPHHMAKAILMAPSKDQQIDTHITRVALNQIILMHKSEAR